MLQSQLNPNGVKRWREKKDRVMQDSSKLRILFLHGWHSRPGGVKPTYLRQHGCQVTNPQLDDDDFQEAIRIAQAEYDLQRPDCVVGSSRGGAVALNMNSGKTPLVLLCPAWKKWGSAQQLKPNSAILHSRTDDVIPFDDSEELVSKSRLPSDLLIEVGKDHRLADDASLSILLWTCEQLVANNQLPCLDEEMLWKSQPVNPQDETMLVDASYICDSCGEQIVIPLDVTEGRSQEYVEDCPVCCRANIIHVQFDQDGNTSVWAEPEQDN